MGSRTSVMLGVVLLALNGVASAQDMPNPQEMQAQVQRIVRERPREAEAAARAFLHVIATQRDLFKVEDRLAELEALQRTASDVYWQEVAQLTVQFHMVQGLAQRDSARAALVTHMFGLESLARTLQRAYRRGNEEQRARYRSQLETLIGGHFDLENQLRLLEIKDIERRLTDVRAETQRRVTKRDEFVRWAVDDIVRDALRPN